MCGSSVIEVYEGGNRRPSDDLAFERWMLERAASGACCAFAYSWPGPVVVLGYAQTASDVDLGWCRDRGIPVLRRLTGGTGVIHRGDLSLSLALPSDHGWAKGVLGLYSRFLGVLEPALRSEGSEVRRAQEPKRASRVRSPICFLDQLSDTLMVEGRKAVGCAQTRRGGAVLIHAAVLLGLDPDLYAGAFGVDRSLVRDRLAPAVPGADWRRVGRTAAVGLADALDLRPRWAAMPDIPHRLLALYGESRWAPSEVDGPPTSSAD